MDSSVVVRYGRLRRHNGIVRVLVVCAVMLLTSVAPAQTPTHENLIYSFAHYRQRLDLYLPAGNGPFPVVVYLHGGGWLTGDRSDVARFVNTLKKRGLAVAAVNYRLSWHAQFPAQIHDVKGAVRWLRANAAEYKLNPDRIGVFGESAGAHLAALLGTSGGVSSLEGNVGGNLQYSSRVQAVALASPPIDLLQWAAYHDSNDAEESRLMGLPMLTVFQNQANPTYAASVVFARSANPITHATPDDPPVAIIHGRLDTVVPCTHSEELRNALVAKGVRANCKLIKRGTHNLPTNNINSLFSFLRKELRR